MLIDSLTYAIERSGALEGFWDKLDDGQDATLGVAASARPFMVAARFAHAPQPTFVVVAGEDAAASFARNVAAYLGDERVYTFPERSDLPFGSKACNPAQIARRLEAAHALAVGAPAVVVASARALLRSMPPANARVHVPITLVAGCELEDMPNADELGLAEFGDVARVLEERGYENTGELEGPGTFCVHGGVIDVHPGNLNYPVRLDFFGDELDEIRRIVPSTGQTISALGAVSIFGVREFTCSRQAALAVAKKLERPARTNPALRELLEQLEGGLHFQGADALLPYLYDKTVSLGDYVGDGVLTTVIEPRSLFDDSMHATDDLREAAKGSNIALEGLFADPARLDFGGGQRATYLSIMRVGGSIDEELPVKRVEVAGHPDKLFGRLHQLVEQDYTVVFSAPNFRARQDMKLAFVERGLPIAERLDVADDGEVGTAAQAGTDAQVGAGTPANASTAATESAPSNATAGSSHGTPTALKKEAALRVS
ncbi:MAG: transcription-repair coupling factor, partial [Eggerthellaceae bacterium]|nr:transcription-repair coupling factor [Eggerthellaceae bacterium]